jgi:hypothetical protein
MGLFILLFFVETLLTLSGRASILYSLLDEIVSKLRVQNSLRVRVLADVEVVSSESIVDTTQLGLK